MGTTPSGIAYNFSVKKKKKDNFELTDQFIIKINWNLAEVCDLFFIGLEPVKTILHCGKTIQELHFSVVFIFQYSEQENQTWLHERKWIVLITKDFITHINFVWKLDLTVAEK